VKKEIYILQQLCCWAQRVSSFLSAPTAQRNIIIYELYTTISIIHFWFGTIAFNIKLLILFYYYPFCIKQEASPSSTHFFHELLFENNDNEQPYFNMWPPCFNSFHSFKSITKQESFLLSLCIHFFSPIFIPLFIYLPMCLFAINHVNNTNYSSLGNDDIYGRFSCYLPLILW